jgi:tetratricopeptide (TPR) repeat protein
VIPASTLTFSVWLLLSSQVGTAAPDRLAGVKALYAAADYDAALIVLSTDDVASVPGADQYRALCLLALGRNDEAERLVESLIRRDPSFRMSVTDVTPRMIALFQQTRLRLLPGILEDRFREAKAKYEQGRFEEATTQFNALTALVADEEASSSEGAVVTRDLRRVVEEFLKLTAAARAEAASAQRPPLPATPEPPDAPASAPQENDATVIARVVQEYVRAYSALSEGAVVRVFQGENPKPLHAMFEALKSQTVEARDLKVALDAGGWSATVTLTWAVQAVPKVGNPTKTQVPATLRMLKVVTGDWFIVSRR